MTTADRSTIFALSSGRPPAAIAVIRISGPRAGSALEAIGVKVPAPRQAKLARIRDPRSGEIIDEALALWFPAPNSETGEDVAELQGHGGPAVIAAILDALGSLDGLRMAEPGEFTRRGFENGKLDLTAVEGLADLVSAETEAQRRQAFRQMKGALGSRAESWRDRLIRALALVEARIDFSDEADVPEDLLGPALAIVQELRDEIGTALADGRGERLREGLIVAIAGPPNAGKSTLLNRLAQREAAIVSPHAGTTRDVIEVHLDLGGYPMTLLDTAGIRDTVDPVEMEGVRRARERAAGADLVLWVTDSSDPDGGAAPVLSAEVRVPVWRIANKADLVRGTDPKMLRNIKGRSGVPTGKKTHHALAGGGANAADKPGNVAAGMAAGVAVAKEANVGTERSTDSAAAGQAVAKATDVTNGTVADGTMDLAAGRAMDRPSGRTGEHGFTSSGESAASFMTKVESRVRSEAYRDEELITSISEETFILSAGTGSGVDDLIKELMFFAEASLSGAEQALVTRSRHRAVLVAVQHILDEAVRRVRTSSGDEELVAEQLRRAATELGRLAGRVDVEDVLDAIFRDFCIGK